VRSDALGKLKKFIHLIGSGTYDLPACSIVRSEKLNGRLKCTVLRVESPRGCRIRHAVAEFGSNE
jgi:hypothetical protein